MIKYLIIKADTNDADYIHSKNIVTDDVLETIMPVIEAIKNCSIKQYCNWLTGDIRRDKEKTPYQLYVETGLCSEEALDYFNDLCPHGEYGTHTIVSIELLEVINEIKLL